MQRPIVDVPSTKKAVRVYYLHAHELRQRLLDLAARKDCGDFRLRIETLRAEHARKPTLIERLNKAGLGSPTPALPPPNAGRVPGRVQTVTGT